ncbi:MULTISPECIES: helix-turn-helix domain-containing protein [unclassified Amycolatopsis]|uniref:helix-turn-helix domain-containing protein n=1 Tax=unclassified Amycolatopsis TaxID=2618356 RepID=UPI00106E8E9B|nr:MULTISPECIES: helix-turn-helix transcriptional regulator [unclassified Amycolatopsis]
MARDPRLVQLGAFLHARRDEAPPPASAETDRRQVPGLRRGEVAALAFVSDEYYTRIEQGRVVPSADVVRRIAAALGLDDDQTQYALDLVTVPDVPPPNPEPSDPLRRLVDRMGEIPAVLVGPATAILAWNAAAARLMTDFGAVPPERRRYVQMLFTDPVLQSRFADLEAMRRTTIGIVRASSPAGPPTGDWIDELLRTDAEFAALWERNDVVRPHTHLRVRLRLPGGVEETVDQIVLQVVDDPHQRLIAFVPAG